MTTKLTYRHPGGGGDAVLLLPGVLFDAPPGRLVVGKVEYILLSQEILPEWQATKEAV